LQLNL